jgi:hypothetical protein
MPWPRVDRIVEEGRLEGAIQEVQNTWIDVAFDDALEEEWNVDFGALARQTQPYRRSQGYPRLVPLAGNWEVMVVAAADIHLVAVVRIDYSAVVSY